MIKDILIVIAIVVIIPLALWIAFIPLAYLINKPTCDNISEISKIKTEFKIFGGCFVEVNGRMIPKRNWYVKDKPE